MSIHRTRLRSRAFPRSRVDFEAQRVSRAESGLRRGYTHIWLGVIFLVVAVSGEAILLPVANGKGSMVSAAERVGPNFQAWQIIHVATGTVVEFEPFLNTLAQMEVIYLGEEHYQGFHIQGAVKILDHILAKQLQPILALEMFGWDGQAALDHYEADPAWDRATFLDEAQWEKNWGGAFEDYEPLLRFARDHGIMVRAMNPPRGLVRKVAKQGLTRALKDPDMTRWGMGHEQFPEDPTYRDTLTQQLKPCHGGLSDEAYERLYEASVFRDEGMAKTIVGLMDTKAAQSGPIISYTGSGHIQYHLPVPNRVQRRRGGQVKQTTVYMASLVPDHPEYIQELLETHIADYVWVTPLGENGPPPRCG